MKSMGRRSFALSDRWKLFVDRYPCYLSRRGDQVPVVETTRAARVVAVTCHHVELGKFRGRVTRHLSTWILSAAADLFRVLQSQCKCPIMQTKELTNP
jgi:hypothetical protein